ncbi:MAG: hypothetical protein LUC24_03205 [Bacteroidales bacterium]|nr:hypothetical protein [Bacteroidales bacterium]
MKNIIKIIVFAAAVSAIVSCQHKAEFSTYSYVITGASALSVNEDTTAVLAVTAYSQDGIAPSTRVSFEIIDGTGVYGTDYTVSPADGVLAFNAEDTQYITIIPVNRPDEITGNFTFTIRLTEATGGYTVGGSYSTSVTIVDLDAANAWTKISTGDYTFGGYYISGEQTGLELYQSDVNPNRYKIAEWGQTGAGEGFYFTWDQETGEVVVEDQFTGIVNPTYGNVYVDEVYHWNGGGNDELSYYSNGIFYFSVIYYVDAGYFGYGYETFALAGSAVPDYSVSVSYAGKYTSASDTTFVIASVASGADVDHVKVALVPGTDWADAIDAIKADEINCKEIGANGTAMFECGESGYYAFVAVSYGSGGESAESAYCTFSFTAGGDSFTPSLEALVGTYDVSVTSAYGSSYDDEVGWIIDYSDDPDYDIMLTFFDGFACDNPIYGDFDIKTGEFSFFGWQYYRNYYDTYDLWFSSYADDYVTFTLTTEGLFTNPTDMFGTFLCNPAFTPEDKQYYLDWNNLYSDAVGVRISTDTDSVRTNEMSVKAD